MFRIMTLNRTSAWEAMSELGRARHLDYYTKISKDGDFAEFWFNDLHGADVDDEVKNANEQYDNKYWFIRADII